MTDKHTLVERLGNVHDKLTPGAIERADLDGMAFTVAEAATRITTLEAEKAELVEALKALPEPYEYLNMAQLKPIRPFIDALNNWSRRFHTTLAKARQSDEGEA